jgi:diketogulonate reductase-like aldo/keto reductase
MELSRRQFMQAAAGAAVIPALGAGAAATLPTRTLGKTGILVSILGFGSGSRFLMYADEEKALAALSRALDLGITYIDTAHSYGDGKSEERIGRLMPERRKQMTWRRSFRRGRPTTLAVRSS